MISGNKCPECKIEGLLDRIPPPPTGYFPWPWRYCPGCGWDEKHQLQEKIRQQMVNGGEGGNV